MNTMTYMDRPEEIEKFDKLCLVQGDVPTGKGVVPVLELMDGGSLMFRAALVGFYVYSQALDDVFDEIWTDPESRKLAAQALEYKLTQVMFNRDRGFLNFDRMYSEALNRSGWPVDRVELAREAHAHFFDLLTGNQFFKSNARAMHILFVSALLRMLAADVMAASNDPRRRELANAVKGGDVDVLMGMIYLHRGWDSAKDWTICRAYDVSDNVVN